MSTLPKGLIQGTPEQVKALLGRGPAANADSGFRLDALEGDEPQVADSNEVADPYKKLQVVFGDELSDAYEPPDELVEGLMTIGSLTVVYGDSNSGKTFWALSLAAAVARGTDCYGRKTDPGIVVYLATEAPAGVKSRMQALKKFYGCNLENFAMVPVPLNFYDGDGDANNVIALVKAIEEKKGRPVRLIVGDTLARMSSGANENAGSDMSPVMARFDKVASASGAALLIIHHNGKDAAKGGRGWSGIRAHIDTEIEVIDKAGIRSACITKQRDLSSKGETIYFKLEILEMGITKFGKKATTCVAVPDEKAAESEPHKSPPAYAKHLELFGEAWWATGSGFEDGAPFLAKHDLINYLVEKKKLAVDTAKTYAKESQKNRLVGTLVEARIIKQSGTGWRVINKSAKATIEGAKQ